jgi:hypothetical protein
MNSLNLFDSNGKRIRAPQRGPLSTSSATAGKGNGVQGGVDAEMGRRGFARASTSSPTRAGVRVSAQQQRIIDLELEVESLSDRCVAYENTVAELRTKLNKLTVKTSTKKGLRETYAWERVDSTYADSINKLCKEWLFPRFKFLHDGWMDYSEAKGSLTMTILRFCPVPIGRDKKDIWDRVIAPTVANKYATMRCNVNGAVRTAFVGECCQSQAFLILAVSHRHFLFCAYQSTLVPCNRGPKQGST